MKKCFGCFGDIERTASAGERPAKLIEDMIFYFRDMLLYQTAPDLEGVLEKVKVDEEFQNLSQQIPSQHLYEMIDILNKSHQEMKWTNHPRIFLKSRL